MKNHSIVKDYQPFLLDIKEKIITARHQAVLAVNSRMIFLYWEIGIHILAQQRLKGWGAKVIDRLSGDLSETFPEMKGLSTRNLKYMRKFAHELPPRLIVQQLAALNQTAPKVKAYTINYDLFVQHPAALLPWAHNMVLMDKVSQPEERLFYAQKSIENGWSRKVLVHQIENELFSKQGRITSNFQTSLPAPMSELARDTFKDTYFFDFIKISEQAQEKDLEDALTEQITKFLLELGVGFAFVGRQHHLLVGNQDYYLDLLFYHTHLHCYVVVELKIGEFKPEYVGKMNFYLTAVDELLKQEHDQASIGLILCKQANKIIAEYAIRDTQKPIGIAKYRLIKSVPAKLRDYLPTKTALKKSIKDKDEH